MAAGHPTSSIQKRAALLASALVAGVLVVFVGYTYAQVTANRLRTGYDRAADASQQLARLLSQSSQQRLTAGVLPYREINGTLVTEAVVPIEASAEGAGGTRTIGYLVSRRIATTAASAAGPPWTRRRALVPSFTSPCSEPKHLLHWS